MTTRAILADDRADDRVFEVTIAIAIKLETHFAYPTLGVQQVLFQSVNVFHSETHKNITALCHRRNSRSDVATHFVEGRFLSIFVRFYGDIDALGKLFGKDSSSDCHKVTVQRIDLGLSNEVDCYPINDEPVYLRTRARNTL